MDHIRKVPDIKLHPCNMNRENGFCLPIHRTFQLLLKRMQVVYITGFSRCSSPPYPQVQAHWPHEDTNCALIRVPINPKISLLLSHRNFFHILPRFLFCCILLLLLLLLFHVTCNPPTWHLFCPPLLLFSPSCSYFFKQQYAVFQHRGLVSVHQVPSWPITDPRFPCTAHSIYWLFLAGFLLGLLFAPEDRCSTFLSSTKLHNVTSQKTVIFWSSFGLWSDVLLLHQQASLVEIGPHIIQINTL
jgi:hypothetical protein